MDMITGKILKLNGWPDGKIIGLAKKAAEELMKTEANREFVLTRLEEVRKNPGAFLADLNMAELARECIRLGNTHALAEHTLLSSNLYRAEYFDAKFGEQNIDTWFPHMFGFLRPLLKNRRPVLIPDFPVISTREEERSVPSDGKWANLDECWKTYLSWLRDEMQMPELDPTSASRAARKAMLANMRSHPIQYFKKYWRALFQPSAYRFLWTRFFGVGK